jgi:hypothetical protein
LKGKKNELVDRLKSLVSAESVTITAGGDAISSSSSIDVQDKEDVPSILTMDSASHISPVATANPAPVDEGSQEPIVRSNSLKMAEGQFLLIYICNFHVFNHFLLITYVNSTGIYIEVLKAKTESLKTENSNVIPTKGADKMSEVSSSPKCFQFLIIVIFI